MFLCMPFWDILVFVLLILCWFMGDCEVRTKLIFTAVFALIQILALVNYWALMGALLIHGSVIWWFTFGKRGR